MGKIKIKEKLNIETKTQEAAEGGAGKSMGIGEVAEYALNKMAKLTKLVPAGVVGVRKSQDGPGWVVKMEFVEKKSIPDSMDILGLYEVKVDNEGNIEDFNRVRLRKRIDTEQEIEL